MTKRYYRGCPHGPILVRCTRPNLSITGALTSPDLQLYLQPRLTYVASKELTDLRSRVTSIILTDQLDRRLTPRLQLYNMYTSSAL